MATDNSWGSLFGSSLPFAALAGGKAALNGIRFVGSPAVMAGAPGLAAATAASVMNPTDLNVGEQDMYVRGPNGQMIPNPALGGKAPTLMPGNGPMPPAPPQAGAAGGLPAAPPSPSPQPGGPPTGLQAAFPFTGAYSPQSLSSSMAFPQVKPPAGGDTPMPTPRPQGAGVPAGQPNSQVTDGNGYTYSAPSNSNPYYNGPGSMNFGAGDQSPGGFGRDSGNTSKGGGLLSKFLAGLAGTNHNGIFGLFNGFQPQTFASGASRGGTPTHRPFVNPDASSQYAGLFGNSMPTDI